jgi:hypothetical protein
MQSCSLTLPALPVLDAILISHIGPYTSQFTVFASSAASLLPVFASPDGHNAATVRIGHSTCQVLSASSPIPHADLNDFGTDGGFLQVLQLKNFIPESMILNKIGAFTQQAVSDVAVNATGNVVITSSAATAHLLQVK